MIYTNKKKLNKANIFFNLIKIIINFQYPKISKFLLSSSFISLSYIYFLKFEYAFKKTLLFYL